MMILCDRATRGERGSKKLKVGVTSFMDCPLLYEEYGKVVEVIVVVSRFGGLIKMKGL